MTEDVHDHDLTIIGVAHIEEGNEKVDKKKNGNRRTSEMWNYFTPVDSDYATCNFCSLKFSYRTSTTNLRKHVVCKHGLQREKNYIADKSPTNDNQIPSSPTVRIKAEPHYKHVFETPGRKSNVFWRHNTSSSDGDEFDAYGVTIAAKLRKMDEKQRLYAEKIINDALFKGALDQLSPLSEIVICIASSSTDSS